MRVNKNMRRRRRRGKNDKKRKKDRTIKETIRRTD